MEEFNIRSISALLTEAMRVKNMSVEKLSQTSGISDRFIELLLEERFTKLPAAPYVRGYMLKIGEILSIDGNDLWEIIKAHHAQSVAQSGEKDKLPGNRFITQATNLKMIVGIIIGILFVGFFLVRLPALFGKPKFELAEFENGIRVSTSTFTIRGTINPSDELFVNDEQLVADESGNFEKTFNLSPEFNTFRFSIRGLLGKEFQETRQVFYEVPEKEKREITNESSTELINNE